MMSTTDTNVFCDATYRTLLYEIGDHGYTFSRFDRPGGHRSFYLRHDVDISPIRAERLARIEHEQGVIANFFFQVGADTYNLMDRNVISIMERVRGMGHLVGLHIDNRLLQSEEAIADTIRWFGHIVPIAPVVSFHRPDDNVLGRTFETFINTYAPDFFSLDRFASDSRCNPAFLDRLRIFLADGVSPIQLVLHPVWWGEVHDLEEQIISRRASEVRCYLSNNFRKVFGDYHEDRPFGV